MSEPPVELDKRVPPTSLQTNLLMSLMYKELKSRAKSCCCLSPWDFCHRLPRILPPVCVARCCAELGSSSLRSVSGLSLITLQTGQQTSPAPPVQPSLPDPLHELQLNEDPWGNLLEAATSVKRGWLWVVPCHLIGLPLPWDLVFAPKAKMFPQEEELAAFPSRRQDFCKEIRS